MELDLEDDDELAVYADALAATDEARAELVAVQQALARAGTATADDLVHADLDDAAYARAAALLRREHQLVAQHAGRWRRALFADDPAAPDDPVDDARRALHLAFARGLPHALTCDLPIAPALLARAAARAPALRTLRLDGVASAAALPPLPQLHALAIGARIDLDDPAALLAAAPHLRALHWRGAVPLDPADLAHPALRELAAVLDDPALVRAPAALAGLERLELLDTEDDLGTLDAPLAALDGRFPAARAIAIRGMALGPLPAALALPAELALDLASPADVATVAALLASPALARVRTLALHAATAADDPLDATRLLAALARAPHLGALERLALTNFTRDPAAPLPPIPAPNLRALALDLPLAPGDAPALLAAHPLRALHLRTRAPAAADLAERLAAAPLPAQLRALTLADSGVTDAGVAALVAAGPALRALGLESNPLLTALPDTLPRQLALLDLQWTEVADLAPLARHANLVELRALPVADQNLRIRLRARLGAHPRAPESPLAQDALVAVVGGDAAAAFAALVPLADTVLDADTLHRVGEHFRVVARAGDLLKLYHRPTAEARAAALAVARSVDNGAIYCEDAARW